jgi:chorismate-pyruvate lyase
MANSTIAAAAVSNVARDHPVPTIHFDIDPFDRMVLTADGTVTTLLGACTGEPIVTRTTRQSGPATLGEMLETVGRWWHPATHLLELTPAERLIARHVTLHGGRSGVAHVLAESLVVPDRLPGEIADCLVRPGASLGRLLATHHLESRREILEIVAVRAAEAGEHLGLRPSATLARRTYAITIGRQTVAAVTEWLPPGRLASASADFRRHHAPSVRSIAASGPASAIAR